MFLAKIFSNKKIIYDPYISFYATEVYEYKKFPPFSFVARLIYFIEYHSLHIPDLLLIDTQIHASFFKKLFFLDNNTHRLLVGTDPSFLHNKTSFENIQISKKKKFIVSYIGYYIPLHGMATIYQSMNYIKDLGYEDKILFKMLGGTAVQQQPYKNYCSQNHITNVDFIDPVPVNELSHYVFESDVQLGIFGTNIKTKLVIPNKVYIGIAAGRCNITADTWAIHEVFTNEKNILLSKIGDPKDLAEKIIWVYHHPEEKKRIAQEGKLLFLNMASPVEIGKELLKIITSLT